MTLATFRPRILSPDRWHLHHMGSAAHEAAMSKDTVRVGAVAVADRRILAAGFNGFPPHVPDIRLDDGPHKRPRTVHAEENVIAWAARKGVALEDASLYVHPFQPCSRCARLICAAGIHTVYTWNDPPPAKWAEDFAVAQDILQEGYVQLAFLDRPA